ncbi:hypothetical protein [Nocardia sp. bgisy134]|uniref:ATP dependent DNA ligase n=1 Tax=unclassified Nocardia TaxID=2637762 RepID=UPI003D72252A
MENRRTAQSTHPPERTRPPRHTFRRAAAVLAHWVEPELVADIEYREATPEGLRHPSWRGIRIDKSPAEIKTPDLCSSAHKST